MREIITSLISRLSNQKVYSAGLTARTSSKRRNLRDLLAGLLRRRLIIHLGISEIIQRYRNTTLGPLWMTLSLSIFLTSLGIVGGTLFNVPLKEYLPFLCAGVVIWAFISAIFNESGTIFLAAPLEVSAYGLPTSVFIYSFIVKQFILFAHNLLIFFLLGAYFSVPFYSEPFWLIAGLLIYIPFIFGSTIIISIVSMKFRDIPEILASILQVMFFATPVMWRPELLEERGRSYILEFNPLYYFIEVLRQPLMGEATSTDIFIITSVISITTLICAIFIYIRFRHRIAFYR